MDRKNYHDDDSERIDNERCAGIVIRDGKVLLIHRIKEGLEYYVFPGGHRRKREKGGNTVAREIEEETSVSVSDPKLIFEFRDYQNNNFEFYYLCNWVSGETPKLNGEEEIRNSKGNFYEPIWVDLDKIGELNILPKFAKEWLERNIIDKK